MKIKNLIITLALVFQSGSLLEGLPRPPQPPPPPSNNPADAAKKAAEEAAAKAKKAAEDAKAAADRAAEAAKHLPPPPSVPLPPPPPLLNNSGAMPKAQRGLLVISAGLSKWSKVKILNPVYDFLQNSGARLAKQELADQYDRIVVLEGSAGTVQAFYTTLTDLTSRYQAVDVIIHSHGNPDHLVFEDGEFAVTDLAAAAVKGGEVVVKNLDTDAPNPALRLNAIPQVQRAHLRMVYETACFGSSHIGAWLHMGFATGAGARAVHTDSAASFPTFLNWWRGGYPFMQCVNEANKADSNHSYDQWIKSMGEFKNDTVDSHRVVMGKATINIGQLTGGLPAPNLPTTPRIVK